MIGYGWRLESPDWEDLRGRCPWTFTYLCRPGLAGSTDPSALAFRQSLVRQRDAEIVRLKRELATSESLGSEVARLRELLADLQGQRDAHIMAEVTRRRHLKALKDEPRLLREQTEQ